MIAGCKYVRWINTQEGATSFIREVKTGLHHRRGGVLRKGTGRWWRKSADDRWARACSGLLGLETPQNRHHGVTLSENPLLLSSRISKPAMAAGLGPETASEILSVCQPGAWCRRGAAERDVQRKRQKLSYHSPLRHRWLDFKTVLRPSALEPAFFCPPHLW